QRFQQARGSSRNRGGSPYDIDINDALETRPGYRNDDALVLAKVADESNLSRHPDLIDDLSSAIDSLTPARGVDRRGNEHIGERVYRGGHARIDLGMVEKEHTDGEDNDERA